MNEAMSEQGSSVIGSTGAKPKYKQKGLCDESGLCADHLLKKLCNSREILTCVTFEHDLKGFLPQLRSYQKAAVNWMFQREKHDNSTKQKFVGIEKLCGGILSEETGLGKTVEILALILLNPQPNITEISEHQQPGKNTCSRKKNIASSNVSCNFLCTCGHMDPVKTSVTCFKCDTSHHLECMFFNPDVVSLNPYICPFCMLKENKASRATLIVCPSKISNQWYSEIQSHTEPGTLNVYCYRGVNKQKFVPPSFLAEQDVVIVTYQTLCSEVSYVESEFNTRFGNRRHPPRYARIPSPLTAVNWWRICLDEAHLVQNSSLNFMERGLQLKCRNKWCATGTPIQKSVTDMQSIFQFLECDPYNEKLYSLFCRANINPIVDALKPIFWRSLKEDVADQMGLLPQTVIYHDLTFSEVEKFFYELQHESCATQFIQQIRSMDPLTTLDSLDYVIYSQIMSPLNKLLKACCPESLSRVFATLSGKVMTMDEISKALVDNAKIYCKQRHNSYIHSGNLVAKGQVMANNFSGAIETYIEVLNSIEREKQHFRSDIIQELVAVHNLGEILKGSSLLLPPGISLPSAMKSIDDLEKRKTHLCSMYLQEHHELLHNAQKTLAQSYADVHELMKAIDLEEFKENPWWRRIFNNMEKYKKEEVFIDKLKVLMDSFSNLPQFTTLQDLSQLCESLFRELLEARDKVIKVVKKLSKPVTDEDVRLAAECHLRDVSDEKMCRFCQTRRIFDDYKTKLFNVTRERISQHLQKFLFHIILEDVVKQQESWSNGMIEELFKNIRVSGRHYQPYAPMQSRKTMHLFDNLRKEYWALCNLWLTARNLVSAMHELNERKKFVMVDQNTYIIHHESLQLLSPLTQECMTYKREFHSLFQTALERLLFVKKAMEDISSKNEQDTCPICLETFMVTFKMLECGHRLCNTCLESLIKTEGSIDHRFGRVRCPVCRYLSEYSEICQGGSSVYFKTKDNYFTKIQSAVESLLKIQQEEPGAKTIIFSCFSEVLCMLDEALKQNNIIFVNLVKGSKFEQNLEKFKHNAEHHVLLLPMKSCISGLNLIEATHIFLMEPWLNPGDTAQAVSRVHQIGKLKQTTVHHFYIKGTVEERIIHSLKKLNSDDKSSFTIEDMKEMFC